MCNLNMNNMKRTTLILLSLLLLNLMGLYAQKYDVSVQKIWDNGSHTAFTSLIEFKGKYYCSFREGFGHVFNKEGKAEGKIRILASADGDTWESVALMHKPEFDLRDPKLSITPDGRLMVMIGGSVYKEKKLEAQIPHVSFSEDGKNFTEPVPVKFKDNIGVNFDWLWRVTWNGTLGYVVDYSKKDNVQLLSLLKTKDGTLYEFVSELNVPDFPNETTIRFLPDETMLLMVRREKGDKGTYWGISKPPYTEWTWTNLNVFVGGPDFIILEDGRIIAGGRSLYLPKSPKTVLYLGDKEGHFEERFVLPSGGDNSYPGMIVVGDQLWVSYYSTHETPKASIYLAKLPLSMFDVYKK